MKQSRVVMLLLAGMLFSPPPALADFIAKATLTGDGESDSPGSGNGVVEFVAAKDELIVDLTFTGLTSPTTIPAGVPGAAHIHFGGPGVSGPILFPFIEPYANNFPVGVTSGTYSTVLTASSLIPDPAAGIDTFSEAVNAIEAGDTYFNIHTINFPGGEIRGQLTVPEPGTWAMMMLGFAGLGFAGYRAARKRSALPA
jgi:hypothetical protein